MMKKYIEPTIEIVKMGTIQVIAASGDEKNDVPFSDTEFTGTFQSRRNDWDDEDE